MYLKFTMGLYAFALIFITALVNSYFVRLGLENFYDTLILPDATPDNKYFSYIWGVCYALLFASFYLVLLTKQSDEAFKDANGLFIVQLFLQVLWVFCFFYLEQIGAAAVVIILLDMATALLLHTFFYINLTAFGLLLPYLAWLLFATYLNIYIAFFN